MSTVTLAVDVSSAVLNAGIDRDGTVFEHYEHGITDHSMHLLPALEKLLADASVTLADISLIALGSGPGSFTSLRVGFSMIKAIAYARDIPVVGVPSLEMLLCNIPESGATRAALIDARKNSVYATVYRGGKAVIENLDIIAEKLVGELAGDTHIIAAGDGALRYRELFAAKLPQMAIADDASMHRMRIANMVAYAQRAKAQGNIGNVMSLLPLYVRPSEAEYNRAKGVIL